MRVKTDGVTQPVLVVHGGAWAIPDELVEAHLAGVRKAVSTGWGILENGGSALEGAETAVAVMEDDEAFDAGRGSFLNSDGRVQLDALIMDGNTLRAGGVGCVERLANPIHAARLVLEKSEHVYLVGEGAERFAQAQGMTLCRNEDLVIPRELERWRQLQTNGAKGEEGFSGSAPSGAGAEKAKPQHDTVGALALDSAGNLAAATSTGGTLNKTPGRLGDSSLIGCGCYADNLSGAVSCTGWGEPIMKLVLGKWAVDRLIEGMPVADAAAVAIQYLETRLHGRGGIILLDPQGGCGIFHNTPRMAWGIKSSQQEEAGITRRRRQAEASV